MNKVNCIRQKHAFFSIRTSKVKVKIVISTDDCHRMVLVESRKSKVESWLMVEGLWLKFWFEVSCFMFQVGLGRKSKVGKLEVCCWLRVDG